MYALCTIYARDAIYELCAVYALYAIDTLYAILQETTFESPIRLIAAKTIRDRAKHQRDCTELPSNKQTGRVTAHNDLRINYTKLPLRPNPPGIARRPPAVAV